MKPELQPQHFVSKFLFWMRDEERREGGASSRLDAFVTDLYVCVLCGVVADGSLTAHYRTSVSVTSVCVLCVCGSRRLTDSSLPYICVRYLCVCTVCCVVADGSLTVHYRTSCPLPLCVYCVLCGSRRLRYL